MSLPSQALDVQLDLERYYQTTIGKRYAAGVVSVAFDPEDAATTQEVKEFGAHVHQAVTMTGETFAVTSSIVEVLEAAAPSIPPYTLHESDLPAPVGFLWLERPVAMADGRGQTLIVRAIGWHVAAVAEGGVTKVVQGTRSPPGAKAYGLMLLVWTDPNDERDHLYGQWQADLVIAKLRTVHGAPPRDLCSMVGGLWRFDQRPESDLFKFLMAFFRFVGEPWVDERAILPDRPTRRRAARAGHVPVVRVVELRKRAPAQAQPSGEPVEWSHRWIVSGHWRNAWCPSIQQHRPVWISEYVKGPEDKPLVVSDRVFHVRR